MAIIAGRTPPAMRPPHAEATDPPVVGRDPAEAGCARPEIHHWRRRIMMAVGLSFGIVPDIIVALHARSWDSRRGAMRLAAIVVLGMSMLATLMCRTPDSSRRMVVFSFIAGLAHSVLMAHLEPTLEKIATAAGCTFLFRFMHDGVWWLTVVPLPAVTATVFVTGLVSNRSLQWFCWQWSESGPRCTVIVSILVISFSHMLLPSVRRDARKTMPEVMLPPADLIGAARIREEQEERDVEEGGRVSAFEKAARERRARREELLGVAGLLQHGLQAASGEPASPIPGNVIVLIARFVGHSVYRVPQRTLCVENIMVLEEGSEDGSTKGDDANLSTASSNGSVSHQWNWLRRLVQRHLLP